MSEITSKHSPLYASLPTIYDHHDQLWAGTPAHFLEHLYDDFDYRADDVWLSSYPRSGTAWTYEVLNAVLYEGDIAALQHAQSEGKVLKFLPIEIGSAAGVSERLTTWKALPLAPRHPHPRTVPAVPQNGVRAPLQTGVCRTPSQRCRGLFLSSPPFSQNPWSISRHLGRLFRVFPQWPRGLRELV